MFGRFFPAQIDNTYRGHRLALWLFALVTALRLAQSFVVIFNGRSTAVSADGIPLDSYPPEAAQTIVALFTLSGLYRLILSLLCLLVLVRYRGATAFMFAVLLLNYLGAQLIVTFVPIVRVGSPPTSFVNLSLLALTAAGLALSLMRGRAPRARE